MANVKKEATNKARVVGWLKENKLELTKDDSGSEVIRGMFSIATSPTSTFRLNAYANRFKKAAEGQKPEENRTFKNWLTLLPSATVSIEDYLKDNPDATFEDATKSASQVYATGSLDEYAFMDGKEEKSYISVKPFNAGIRKPSDKNPFDPKAIFEIDVFIEKMAEVVDEDGEETGEIELVGLTPDYSDTMSRITYKTGDKNSYEHISDNYSVGQTVYLMGDIVNIFETKVKEQAKASFGRKAEDQIETVFSDERLIFGGSPTPLEEDEDGAFTVAFVKEGLAKREERIATNTEKRENKEANSAPTRGFGEKKNTAPKKDWKFSAGKF